MAESVIMDFLSGIRTAETQETEAPDRQQELLYIDIDDLIPSEDNPVGIREVEKIKPSIELLGVLQPLLVKPVWGQEGKYAILAGHNRRQAVKELVDEGKDYLRKVKCVIKEDSIKGENGSLDAETIEIADRLSMFFTNRFKTKTDWEKMEECREIQGHIKKLKEKGKIKGEVRTLQMEFTGETSGQIARYMAVSKNLSAKLMQDFKADKFSISIAYALSSLPEDYQKRAEEILQENKILTLPDVEKLKTQEKEERQISGQMVMGQQQEKAEIPDTEKESEVGNVEEEGEEQEGRKPELKCQKPDGRQREYLESFAKYFIRCEKTWFLEDSGNRAHDAGKSPDFIKEHLGLDRRTWYFSMNGKAAHINLFEDYVQVWDESGECLGNFEWFYLAAAIQSMWNVVSLEDAEKKRQQWGTGSDEQQEGQKERTKCWKECHSVAGKEDSAAPSQQENTQPVSEKEQEIVETEEEAVVPVLQTEAGDEKDEILSEKTDLELAEEMLWKENWMLADMLKCYVKEDYRVRKQKLKVAAFASMVCDLEEMETAEPEQPELPAMRNDEQRKGFIDGYAQWPLWIDQKETGERYYRYNFPNGSSFVVKAYYHRCFDYTIKGRPWQECYTNKFGAEEYYLLVEGKCFKDCRSSKGVMAEFLKEIQKG